MVAGALPPISSGRPIRPADPLFCPPAARPGRSPARAVPAALAAVSAVTAIRVETSTPTTMTCPSRRGTGPDERQGKGDAVFPHGLLLPMMGVAKLSPQPC